MIEVQKWLLHLCIACILVTVLSSFIKNEKVNISIKSVLALYILVITLNSIVGIDIKLDNSLDTGFEASQAVDSEDLIIKNAQQNICNKLNEMFAELSVETRCKAVTLNIDKASVDTVMLTDNNTEAVKAVKDFLGDKIKIVIEKEGKADG